MYSTFPHECDVLGVPVSVVTELRYQDRRTADVEMRAFMTPVMSLLGTVAISDSTLSGDDSGGAGLRRIHHSPPIVHSLS